MGLLIDITGKKFGRLLAIGRIENDGRGESRWLCKCDCGNESVVLGSHLRSGRTVSCGCYSKEVASNHVRAMRISPNSRRIIYPLVQDVDEHEDALPELKEQSLQMVWRKRDLHLQIVGELL